MEMGTITIKPTIILNAHYDDIILSVININYPVRYYLHFTMSCVKQMLYEWEYCVTLSPRKDRLLICCYVEKLEVIKHVICTIT